MNGEKDCIVQTEWARIICNTPEDAEMLRSVMRPKNCKSAKSLWHERSEAPDCYQKVLMRGYRTDDVQRKVYRVCVFANAHVYNQYIIDGESDNIEFEEWAYCDELYRAVVLE